MPKNVTVKIPDEVKTVLAAATWHPDRVVLNGQLDRVTYLFTDKVLKAAGLKWNKSKVAHVGTPEAVATLRAVLEDGDSLVDTKKTLEQFFTPVVCAEAMAARVLGPRMRVLEPSAGSGRLADAAAALGAEVTCVEIDPVLAEGLRAKGYTVFVGDFMKMTIEDLKGPFDAVIMNPPFYNGADVEHVMRAYDMLKHNGRLTAIVSTAWRFRSGRKWEKFRELVAGETVQDLPAGTFSEAGTSVATNMIHLVK